jgi:hypothetical protein
MPLRQSAARPHQDTLPTDSAPKRHPANLTRVVQPWTRIVLVMVRLLMLHADRAASWAGGVLGGGLVRRPPRTGTHPSITAAVRPVVSASSWNRCRRAAQRYGQTKQPDPDLIALRPRAGCTDTAASDSSTPSAAHARAEAGRSSRGNRPASHPTLPTARLPAGSAPPPGRCSVLPAARSPAGRRRRRLRGPPGSARPARHVPR